MQSERRKRIQEYIDTHGEATITALQALCSGCSNMTIWRDLKALESEGCILRTRGGAISTRGMQPNAEGLYSQRENRNPNEKRAIAQLAAPYIRPGQALYLDAGSTVMSLVKLLRDQAYTIITSGANISIELSKFKNCNIIALGGQINGNTLSCSGPQAETVLNSLNIDTAIMATSGFSLANGFTAGTFSEAELKRQVMQKAGTVVMLMDHTKINKSMPYTFATLEDIDVWITDAPLPADVLMVTEAQQVTILVAKP